MPDAELCAGQLPEAGEVSNLVLPSSLEGGEEGGRQSGRGSASLEVEGPGGGNDGTAACPAVRAGPVAIVASKTADATVLKVWAPKSVDGWLGAAPGAENGGLGETPASKKVLPKSDSYQEECRVCQEETDEPLVNLGCSCRGELSKAHLSCIEIWFHARGSNKCEICQQVAANVPIPESQPNANYWIWRVDPTVGGTTNIRRRGHGRERCLNPLWIAFCILIGGLLLDVLISVSFGVSALPVNIIIGALIILGMGTALRLVLDCCHEWNAQRLARRAAEAPVDPHYPPDV